MMNSIRAVAVLMAVTFLCVARAADDGKTGGQYVPTPQVVVEQMLRFGKVTDKDFVIDLGSGDGVIVLTAGKEFNASGMGIDIDPNLVALSNDSAQRLGIADRVRFQQLDVFKADLSKASVLTLYLLPSMMINLRSKLFNELKPGVRVISHDYHLGEWAADDQITFDVPEKEKINGVPKATLYLWYVPARIAGKWTINVAGGESYELAVRQRFQSVDGTISAGGKSLRTQTMALRGNDLTFSVADAKGLNRFTGQLKNDTTIEGTVEMPGGKAPARWSATRISADNVITE